MANRSSANIKPPERWTHSPQEYYLRYALLLDKEGGFTQLAAELERKGVIFPRDEGRVRDSSYLEELRDRMARTMPSDFRPDDLRHDRSQDFLRAQRIWGAWHRVPEMLDAERLFFDPPMRERVCGLLVARFDPEQATKVMAQDLGCLVRPRTFLVFEHYFWNLSLLTFSEREALLRSPLTDESLWRAHVYQHGRVGKGSILGHLGYRTSELSHYQRINDAFVRVSNAFPQIDQLPNNPQKWMSYDHASRAIVGLSQEGRAHQEMGGRGEEEEALMRFVRERSIRAQRTSLGELSQPDVVVRGLPGRRESIERLRATGAIIDTELDEGEEKGEVG